MSILGIDVHGDKGPIDWRRVRAAGIQFAFVKASEGATFVDARVGTNLKEAQAAGIFVGPYHYARPDNRPSAGGAVVEADHFCDVIETIYDPKVHGPNPYSLPNDFSAVEVSRTGLDTDGHDADPYNSILIKVIPQ